MKLILRIIGWIVLAAVALCLSAFGLIYYQFNNFHIDDPYPVVAKNLSFYTNDYASARLSFRNNTDVLKNRFPGVRVSQIRVRDRENLGLTIDVCYIPASKSNDNLLILSSGTHGIEGYVGSACQSMFMTEYLNDSLLEDCGILLIHAINPHGFHHNRRVTENNVDLNRNCSLSGELYGIENPGYTMVDGFINPRRRLDMDSLGMRFFFLRTSILIARHSMAPLRQSVLQGQYTHPQGVWYGGMELEPQIAELVPLIRETCDPYDRVIAIDLHTGYGDRSRMHLISNPVENALQQKMNDLFGDHTIDFGDQEDFYSPYGEVIGMIGEVVPDKICIPMTFEFGTLDSQTMLGAIKSIQTMVAENQAFQFGCDSDASRREVAEMFMEMFYPKSTAWRSNAIEQFKSVLDELIPKL